MQPAVSGNQYLHQPGPPKPAVIHRTSNEASVGRRNVMSQFADNAPGVEQHMVHPQTSHHQYAMANTSNMVSPPTNGLL